MSMWRNAAGKPVSARNEKMWFEPTRKRPGEVVVTARGPVIVEKAA